MQIHRPDFSYTSSERARRSFRLAVKITLVFIAVLWLIHLLGWALNLPLYQFGIAPREIGGLPGILLAPLLHGSFGHLISNSLPLLVLGVGILYLYPNSAFTVFPIVYLGTGLAVWLFARPAFHIGASGLIYGLAAYIFVAGVIRRDSRAIAASLLVYFLYGTLLWGLLPAHSAVSWETHLAAALIGIALAVHFRHLDIPPRKRYSWEDEEEDDDDDEYDDDDK